MSSGDLYVHVTVGGTLTAVQKQRWLELALGTGPDVEREGDQVRGRVCGFRLYDQVYDRTKEFRWAVRLQKAGIAYNAYLSNDSGVCQIQWWRPGLKDIRVCASTPEESGHADPCIFARDAMMILAKHKGGGVAALELGFQQVFEQVPLGRYALPPLVFPEDVMTQQRRTFMVMNQKTHARLCYDGRWRSEHAPIGGCSYCVKFYKKRGNAIRRARRTRDAAVVELHAGDTLDACGVILRNNVRMTFLQCVTWTKTGEVSDVVG